MTYNNRYEDENSKEDKKYTISIPEKLSKKMTEVMENLSLKTIAGTFVLGIETLHWIYKMQKDGFEIKAEKNNGSNIIIKKFPSIIK